MTAAARRRPWLVPALFALLALLNLVTRDLLGAAGWALLALALWLRESARPRSDWRRWLGRGALAGALVILVVMAGRLLSRFLG